MPRGDRGTQGKQCMGGQGKVRQGKTRLEKAMHGKLEQATRQRFGLIGLRKARCSKARQVRIREDRTRRDRQSKIQGYKARLNKTRHSNKN